MAANRIWFWSMESTTQDEGTTTQPLSFDLGAALSTEQAYQGTQSLKLDNQIYSQVQAFNDTPNEEFAGLDEGAHRFWFYVPSGTTWDTCMLAQLGDKIGSNPYPGQTDTNSSYQVNLESVGGGGSNGLVFRWGPNGTFDDITTSEVLDLSSDNWHEGEVEWSTSGSIDGNKYLVLRVNGKLWAFKDTPIDAMSNYTPAYTNQNIGNDLNQAREFFLDNWELYDGILNPAPAPFVGKEIFLAVQDDNAPADTFKSWNSILTPAASIADMVDSTGASTGISWTPGTLNGAQDRTGSYSQVGTIDLTWVDEAIVMSEYNRASGECDYTIGGLDTEKLYSISVCSAYTSRRGEFTVDGWVTIEQQVFNFTDATKIPSAEFVDIVPNGAGEINFRMRPQAGSDYVALNALRIREYDAPTPPPVTGGGITRPVVRSVIGPVIKPVIN